MVLDEPRLPAYLAPQADFAPPRIGTGGGPTSVSPGPKHAIASAALPVEVNSQCATRGREFRSAAVAEKAPLMRIRAAAPSFSSWRVRGAVSPHDARRAVTRGAT